MGEFTKVTPKIMEKFQIKPSKKRIPYEVNVIFDRKQPLIRIPTKIALEMGIEEGDKMMLILDKKESEIILKLKK